ncbi:hypothetical protein BC826DRAFT_1079600 [Russula brevipes]|nr:hypothetical protein BC826DRAFT_1079600 [Russula brevipes]
MVQRSMPSIFRGTLQACRRRSVVQRISYRTPERCAGSSKSSFNKNRDASFGKMGMGVVSAVAALLLGDGAGAPLLSGFLFLPFPFPPGPDVAFLGGFEGVSSFRRPLVPRPLASILVSFAQRRKSSPQSTDRSMSGALMDRNSMFEIGSILHTRPRMSTPLSTSGSASNDKASAASPSTSSPKA